MVPQPSFKIIDDFLDEAAWTSLWTEFQFADLRPVTRTSGAWKLDDGVPLGGQEIVTPPREEELAHDPEQPHRYPSQTALDAVITALFGSMNELTEIVGDSWARVSARPYVYPRGTALSWHSDDHALTTGAFVYYAHPHWNAHWGGELLIADEPDEELPIMGHRFETESYSAQLLERGAGRFVMPKPNRLVVLAGAPHAVARVADAAGQNVRASVSGFFLRAPS